MIREDSGDLATVRARQCSESAGEWTIEAAKVLAYVQFLWKATVLNASARLAIRHGNTKVWRRKLFKDVCQPTRLQKLWSTTSALDR